MSACEQTIDATGVSTAGLVPGSRLAILVASVTATAPAPLLDAIGRHFGLSHTQIGLVYSILSAGYLLGGPLSGAAADRVGTRWPGVIGSMLVALGLGVAAWSPTYAMLLVGIWLVGLGGGTLMVMAATMVSAVAGQAQGKALGRLHAYWGLGSITGSLGPAAAYQWGWASWQAIFGWLAALGVAGAILIGLVRSAPRPDARPPVGAPTPPLGMIGFGLLCLAMFFYVGSEWSFSGWVCKHQIDVHQATPISSAISLATFWAVMGLGRLLASTVADYRRLRALILVGSLVGGTGIIAIAWWPSNSPVQLGALSLVTGLAYAGIYPSILALYLSSRPSREGLGLGVLSASGEAGAMLLPVTAGVVGDRMAAVVGPTEAGRWALSPLGLSGLLCAVCILVAWLITRRRQRRPIDTPARGPTAAS